MVEGSRNEYPMALPKGTVLCGKYILQGVLGQGGFGITYSATDYKSGKVYAIKEYLPQICATRTGQLEVMPYSASRAEEYGKGKADFLKEAETLARFNAYPGIVHVLSYFEEHGTAYFVMEYIEGRNLQQYLRARGGKLGCIEALQLLLPIVYALDAVHKAGIVHRDVKPGNILIKNASGTANGGLGKSLIRSTEEVKLIDFGAARISQGDRSQSLSVVLTHGFAPVEQYRRHSRQGPWTDLYALAATFYYTITGVVPPDSLDRMVQDELLPPSKLGIPIPPRMEAVLGKALSVQAVERYQTMGAFAAELERSMQRLEAAPDPVTMSMHGAANPVATPMPAAAVNPVANPLPNAAANPAAAPMSAHVAVNSVIMHTPAYAPSPVGSMTNPAAEPMTQTIFSVSGIPVSEPVSERGMGEYRYMEVPGEAGSPPELEKKKKLSFLLLIAAAIAGIALLIWFCVGAAGQKQSQAGQDGQSADGGVGTAWSETAPPVAHTSGAEKTGSSKESNAEEPSLELSSLEGWVQTDGKYMFFKKGVAQKDTWVESNGNQFYLDKDGYMAVDRIVTFKGAYYYVNEDGAMVSDTWAKAGGRWYYLEGDGKAKTSGMMVDENGEDIWVFASNGEASKRIPSNVQLEGMDVCFYTWLQQYDKSDEADEEGWERVVVDSTGSSNTYYPFFVSTIEREGQFTVSFTDGDAAFRKKFGSVFTTDKYVVQYAYYYTSKWDDPAATITVKFLPKKGTSLKRQYYVYLTYRKNGIPTEDLYMAFKLTAHNFAGQAFLPEYETVFNELKSIYDNNEPKNVYDEP